MRKTLFIIAISLFSIISNGQEISGTTETRNDTSTVQTQNQFANLRTDVLSTKAVGDSAYMKGDYLTAIQVYEDLLQQGESAEVYYNLGNSYYKSGDIAHAILNYERALLLQPNDSYHSSSTSRCSRVSVCDFQCTISLIT